MKQKQINETKKPLKLILRLLEREKYFGGLFIQLWIFFSDRTLKLNEWSFPNSGVVKLKIHG